MSPPVDNNTSSLLICSRKARYKYNNRHFKVVLV